MEIVIRDLPGDVDEQALRDYLQPYGDIEALTVTNEGNHQRASATVDMPLSAAVAEAVCDRIRHNPFDGHSLRAEVILFFK